MSKKQKNNTNRDFSTGAFNTLKSLKDKNREIEEARAEAERIEAQKRARLEQERIRETRDLRFTEADLADDSSLSDEEIFAASMAAMDAAPIDLFQSKFNSREIPKSQKTEEPPAITLSDEEREFAIFTQEMALSNVQRLVSAPKKTPKPRNKKKFDSQKENSETTDNSQEIPKIELSSVKAASAESAPGMKTDCIAHNISVTQIEKGSDIIEQPEPADAMTASQKKLLKDVHHYESRYGMLMTLRLRGLTLNAAISRLDDFIGACIRERRPYALIICGKGLHSADHPVIKENTIDMLRNDARVIEYAPVINEDGDFGSIYAAFKLNHGENGK